MNAPGTATKILNKIKEAQTPDRFTRDFLSTKLGFPGGTAAVFIPLAKRIGFLESDGRPTDLYKSFRNPDQSRAAMAAAIRKGYSQFYERNEYVHDLERKKLEGLVTEMTGLEQGDPRVRGIVGTFESLKSFADFNRPEPKASSETEKEKSAKPKVFTAKTEGGDFSEDLQLNLAYTINLVLPKTDDIAVFNAIFKSLKENLLRK
jgi:hypothetical protein